MGGRIFLIAAASMAMVTAPAAAQDDEALPDAGLMARLAADLPVRTWYPEGYYDVRLAAEAQVAETPRDLRAYVGACGGGGGQCYDPVDLLPRHIGAGESDPAVRRYGNVALDVARLAQELARAGYPAAIYEAPLLRYEQTLVEAARDDSLSAATATAALQRLATAVEANRAVQTPGLPCIMDVEDYAARVVVVRSSGPSAGAHPAGKKLASEAKITLKAGDRIELLTANGLRTLTGPGTFSVGQPPAGVLGALLASPAPRRAVGAVRGGRAPVGVTLQTNPPSGEVLMLSAFAFRICQRKNADPWDRFQCRWNEIETGVARPLSGRFVYQVRWPDGTVRKGSREIAPDQSGPVTFKKVGSR